MCPAFLGITTLIIAGASSTTGLAALVGRNFAADWLRNRPLRVRLVRTKVVSWRIVRGPSLLRSTSALASRLSTEFLKGRHKNGPIVEPVLNEFREEIPTTRRVLERVPGDKFSWKPHPKSRSLGELELHVASIPAMAERIAESDEFSAGSAPPPVANSVEEIRAAFQKNAHSAEEHLGNMSDQTAEGKWRLVFRGKEIFNKPRAAVLRAVMLNHMYHHRGQRSVYLRLLDIPVPVVYGPTADENPFG